MAFGKVAAASLVFGILYAVMFVYMCGMYATKRYKWKSRFTILFIHAAIRVASQSCGVAFGILLWKNTNVFIAYLILGAEGYFSLTIASYYFLRHYELRNFNRSRLGKLKEDQGTWRRTAQIWSWMPLWAPWRYVDDNVIMIVDSWLIPANALIIAGGSLMVAAMNPEENHLTAAQAAQRLNMAKGFRTAGSAVFLALTCVWVAFVANAFRKTVRAGLSNRARTACLAFSVIGFFLVTRGVFGLLQSAIWKLSYYNKDNYDQNGFTTEFVAVENVLAVMPEFIAAALLNASWWATHKHAHEVIHHPEEGDGEGDGEGTHGHKGLRHYPAHQDTKSLNV